MQDSTSLLVGLNPAQKEAVLHDQGPAVVFAGAGSGKTRVIATRVAYLVSKGVPAWEILAMTFTNKAAKEMRERILGLCPEAKRSHVSTFHAQCARWLREFATELGFTSDFLIYDDKDSTQLIKELLGELVKKDQITTVTPEIKRFIGHCKTAALLPHESEAAVKLFQFSHISLSSAATEIYRRYQSALAGANAMDFGDLLMNMILLLRRHKKIRTILQNRYHYLMVDEYQDTNRTQSELVDHLTKTHNNVFVVGDDDQSIYSWRGALPAHIIHFAKRYPECKTIRLEQNYRCSKTIVDAAGHLIVHNKTRADKTIFTDNPKGPLIDVLIEPDNPLEADAVAQKIKEEIDDFPHHEIAIFYRTNAQSRPLEEALYRNGIPYLIYGAIAFYERLEVKDILAYMRLVTNESDHISFRRILNVPPRGIGKKTLETIEASALENSCSLMAAAKSLYAHDPAHKKKLHSFFSLYAKLEKIRDLPLNQVLEYLLGLTQYDEYLKKKFKLDYDDKIENIFELGAALQQASTAHPDWPLSQWLQSITLERQEDRPDLPKDSVQLMTLHMAKGLEFDRVYIVGVEERLLPHQNSLESIDKIEEERRLMYVGMTRARKKLSLLAAEMRQVYNKVSCNPISRFVQEIPEEYLQTKLVAAPEASYDPRGQDLIYEDLSPAQNLEAGSKVFHPTYGNGVIVQLEVKFGQSKAIVDFIDFGPRSIRLSQLRSSSASLSF